MTTTTPSYKSLEELQQRKDALRADIHVENQKIGELWSSLTTSQPSNSKGEMIANLVTNSITAIDAFIMVRKLMKIYVKYFHKKKKKK